MRGHNPNFKDETGNKYGRLTVEKLYKLAGYSGAVWLCKCDCGNEVAVLGTRLRSGNTRSCGCLREMHPEDRINMGYMPYGRERVISNSKEKE